MPTQRGLEFRIGGQKYVSLRVSNVKSPYSRRRGKPMNGEQEIRFYMLVSKPEMNQRW